MKEIKQGLSPSDFLVKQKIPTTLPPGVLMPDEDMLQGKFDVNGEPIPTQMEDFALHKEEQFVTRDRKAAMDAEISKIISKEDLAQERVEFSIDEIKNKYKEAPKHPRDILNDLLLKGELRKTYDVANHKWEMRALDQGDILLASDDLKDSIENESGRYAAFVFSKVIYSIEAIDGFPVHQFFPEILPTQFNSKIEFITAIKKALRAYLVGMPHSIIDILHLKLLELEQERDDAILKLKNS